MTSSTYHAIPFAAALLSLVGACATTAPAPANPRAAAIELGADLRVIPLAEGVWLHVSEAEVEGFGNVSGNGLVIVGAGGALLVDTPWTPGKTAALVRWIERDLGRPLTDVVVTHAHGDSAGGVSAIPPGARLHARRETAAIAAGNGAPFEATWLKDATTIHLGGAQVEVFFPGAGHAPDNVVVHLPARRLLFGGCFVKAAAATDLGNLADADVPAWRASIARVRARYPDLETVVPGHGAVGGAELLAHTARLIDEVLAPRQTSGGGDEQRQRRQPERVADQADDRERAGAPVQPEAPQAEAPQGAARHRTHDEEARRRLHQ